MHRSLWLQTGPQPRHYTPLEEDLTTDVVVIGAGITGLTTALHLVEAGRKVAVIDSGLVGQGVTGWSTGNLYVPVQPYLHNVISNFDEETAALVIRARGDAIRFIEDTAARLDIACQFSRRPWYLYAMDERQKSTLEKEADALRKGGMTAVEETNFPLPFRPEKALRIDGQARFHPYAFVSGLAANLAERGCRIFEHTPARDVKDYEDYCIVETDRGRIRAGAVVSATHVPKGVSAIQMVAAPYRSYVLGVTLRGGIYPDGIFWDLESPHHSISSHSRGGDGLDVLLIAGEHHKTGQPSEEDHEGHFGRLVEYARENFDVGDVVLKWSAQHYHSGDGLPYIGTARNDSARVYIATGFYADGLPYGVIAAQIISDRILGRSNPLAELLDSHRHNILAAAKEFVSENLNVVGQYLRDLPVVTKAGKFEEIEPGSGRVVRVDGERVAAYRDDDGRLHTVSAVCTHMACIVKWNDAERTWDCPCHGSRFRTDGEVLEGPAYRPLQRKNGRSPDNGG